MGLGAFHRVHRRHRAAGTEHPAAPGRHGGRHRASARTAPVLLVSSGDHAAALLPVLRALPEATDLVVILRMATREDLTAGADAAEVTLRRGGRLVELSGGRSAVALDAARLQALVPDLATREVHVCGPASFVAAAVAAAQAGGVPEGRIYPAHSSLSGSSQPSRR
jgi:ferredoxin-NADP reductase